MYTFTVLYKCEYSYWPCLLFSEGAPTRLSPRASSEGSGSLEDSGHVSGTSTENTPEHRRTDSAVSQLSVPSSTLSTVTDVSTGGGAATAQCQYMVHILLQ